MYQIQYSGAWDTLMCVACLRTYPIFYKDLINQSVWDKFQQSIHYRAYTQIIWKVIVIVSTEVINHFREMIDSNVQRKRIDKDLT